VEILPPYIPTEEEKQSPTLYANHVRELMATELGAELSEHSIKQQQALKRNGMFVDWTGRYIRQRTSSSQRAPPGVLVVRHHKQA
jgi:lysophosphatidylcholine acyltransferase/lyso-PAF acetyltransferase